MPNIVECNTPQNCPMETKEFIKKLSELENEMKQSREFRRDLNFTTNNTLNEIKVTVLEQGEEIDMLQTDTEELKVMIKELIGVMKGVMGRDGIIQEIDKLKTQTKELQDWKRDIKGFIAGVVAAASIISAMISGVITTIINTMKG